MTVLALFAVLASTLASLAVGARMLLLARRTRKLPELCMGLALALSGGFGVLFSFLARAHAEALGEGASWLLHVARILILLGAASVGLFTWRVFRPRTAWATLFFAAATATLLAIWAIDWVRYGSGAWPEQSVPFWITHAIRASLYGWSALEAGLYLTKLRRRRRLGLADAVVANRVLLWTVTMVAAVYMHAPLALRQSGAIASEPLLHLLVSVGGLVTAGALWLAFFPPRSYVRRVAASG